MAAEAFLGLLFIIAVVFIYYSVGDKYKNPILFGSSLVFIAVLSVSVAVFSLLFTICNYFLGLMLQKYSGHARAKSALFRFSIFVDVGILAFFKYFNFFFKGFDASIFSSGIYANVPYLSVMAPIGISYYTFQALGYLIRINRGSEKAETDFSVFATYLLFFPKFLSGPVTRSNHFLPQLKKTIPFELNNLESGARLILWGVFKKVVIAENLYQPVSQVYSDVHEFSGLALIIILMVQTIYIYFDFSGYTDMALGLAKIFGINLFDNFNRPFLAKNISDFWRRWHISLSSWCNDFIYNPFIIKFRRFGNTAVIFGIFLTFFIVGIWHGARLTFVILGVLQGLAIIYEFYTKRYRLKLAARFSKSIVNAVSRIIVFLFMSLSLTFFFSSSVADAWYFITHLFSGVRLASGEINFIISKPRFFFALFCFIILFIIEMLNEKGRNLPAEFLKQPFWIRWAAYISCGLLIYFSFSEIHPFYYMKF